MAVSEEVGPVDDELEYAIYVLRNDSNFAKIDSRENRSVVAALAILEAHRLGLHEAGRHRWLPFLAVVAAVAGIYLYFA